MSGEDTSHPITPQASQEFVVAPRARAPSFTPQVNIDKDIVAAKPGQKSQLNGWSDNLGSPSVKVSNPEPAAAAAAAATDAVSPSNAAAKPSTDAKSKPKPEAAAAASPAKQEAKNNAGAANAGEGGEGAPTLSKQQLRKQQKLQAKQQKQQQREQQQQQQQKQEKQDQKQGQQKGQGGQKQQGDKQQGQQQGGQQQKQQGGQQKERAKPAAYGTLHSMFTNLPQYSQNLGDMATVPPCITRIGIQMAEMELVGSNARCVAMLKGFVEVFETLTLPPDQKNPQAVFNQAIKKMVGFLVQCRPMSVSMRCAITYVKNRNSMYASIKDFEEIRRRLIDDINTYIENNIEASALTIAGSCADKINNGDVVATYGMSSVVANTLMEAHARGKKFQTVIIDSAPSYEGRELLRRLSAADMECDYTLLSGTSYVIRKATKVILGAHAMLFNGVMMGRSGTAIVAIEAHAAHVPVIVCCEGYKFMDRAQLDSIEMNQMGDPNIVLTKKETKDFYQSPAAHKPESLMTVLNPLYDITPMEYITAVCCELGIIPATSVPVIVREFHQDQIEQIHFEEDSAATTAAASN